MSGSSGLRQQAWQAFVWSLVQNWGGRALASVVFVALARLLSPADFGLAASAFLALSFLSTVAEFGFGDAIVQRRVLAAEDINLPLYASLAASILLAGLAIAFAHPLANLIGKPAVAPYLAGSAAIAPMMMVAGFQEALYRRALRFADLAIRTLAGTVLGGIVGIGVAFAGLGPWAIVAQFATQTLVSVAWLSLRSPWRPGLALRWPSFAALARFGAGIVGMRVVDFVTLRSVDLVILTGYGAAALGLFAVSSRLYQLLMQLLQASISSVGLSVLSKVEERERLASLFVRTTSISAAAATPVFVGLAAVAPEANRIFFGAHWAAAAPVMRPLLLIGGLHCIQFTMGAYLTAVGRPQTLFRLMLLKSALVLPPVMLIRAETVAGLATIYACALAAEAPFILAATIRHLGLDWRRLPRPVLVPLLASAAGYGAAAWARAAWPLPDHPLGRGVLLGAVFAAVDLALLALLARDVVRSNVQFVRRSFR